MCNGDKVWDHSVLPSPKSMSAFTRKMNQLSNTDQSEEIDGYALEKKFWENQLTSSLDLSSFYVKKIYFDFPL